MSYETRVWNPEKRSDDCWDWTTPEDVCRHALASYYLAKESMKQPQGRPFVEHGAPWSDRSTFGENVALLFEMRLKTDGYHLGIQQDWAVDAKQLQLWTAPRKWLPDESGESTTEPGYGVEPHGSEAEADPDLSTGQPCDEVQAAAAAGQQPQKPSAP